MRIEAAKDTFFPKMLKQLPVWVLWRLEEVKKKNGEIEITKVPYQVTGKRASSTNPDQWTTFEKVSATLARYPDRYGGLGTVMSKRNRLIFIDIDHCLDDEGNTDPRADDILEAFTDDDGNLTQYIELSQSGTGIHIITVGDIDRSFKNSRFNVEMYADGRFCAMTGRAISANEPTECEIAIRYVFEKYKTKSATDVNTRKIDPATQKSDRWIIEHASARTDSKFPSLFAGDWAGAGYGSQSEADFALCKILAFWTNNDSEAIDRIFRMSGLYRAKWERMNYSKPTIQKAISSNDDTLAEFTRRSRIAKAVKAYEWIDTVGRNQQR